MPSPVGHSLAGYLIYQLIEKPTGWHRWSIVVFGLIAANAADLDFIPGLLMGAIDRYHHGISHSIGFAVLFGFAFSVLLYLYKRAAFWRNFTISFCIYFSHVVLDYFSNDTRVPYGVPIYWPLDSEYYLAPVTLFSGITRDSSSGATFVSSLFSMHNLWSVCVELVVFLPFVILLLGWSRKPEHLSE